MAMCPGPIGGSPCGSALPDTSGLPGRPRVRCVNCSPYKPRKPQREAEMSLEEPVEDELGLIEEPIEPVVLPIELVDELEKITGKPKAKAKHCSWLGHDGIFCNAKLREDTDELFCDGHGMPSRAYFEPKHAFVGPGVIPDEPSGPGPLESAHLEALSAINMENSVQGALVLRLAQMLDGDIAPTAAAALAAQLRVASKEAYSGTPPSSSSLDELRARREARIAAMNNEEVSDG